MCRSIGILLGVSLTQIPRFKSSASRVGFSGGWVRLGAVDLAIIFRKVGREAIDIEVDFCVRGPHYLHNLCVSQLTRPSIFVITARSLEPPYACQELKNPPRGPSQMKNPSIGLAKVEPGMWR